MMYYAARRNDNRVVLVGSSPNIPDIETYLTNALVFGGTLDDYQFVELSAEIYAVLETNLHRLPYYDGQNVTYSTTPLTYSGGDLAGSFSGDTVTVRIYDLTGELYATKETALVNGAYSEYVIVPAGYKVRVTDTNDMQGEIVL